MALHSGEWKDASPVAETLLREGLIRLQKMERGKWPMDFAMDGDR